MISPADVDKLMEVIHAMADRLQHMAHECRHNPPQDDCPSCRDTAAYEAYLELFPHRRPAPVETVALQDVKDNWPEEILPSSRVTPWSSPIPKPPGSRRGHEPSCEALFGYRCTCQ